MTQADLDQIQNKLIKHIRAMDVCLYSSKATLKGDKIHIAGWFVNMAFIQSFVIDHAQVDIDVNDFKDWLICDEGFGARASFAPCYRDSEWYPVKI